MTKINWLNANGGLFSQGSDWSGGAVPGAADDVVLPAFADAAFTVTANTDQGVQSLRTAANATLAIDGFADFTVAPVSGPALINAGTIEVNNHARMTVEGAIVNRGSIDLNHHGLDLVVGPETTLGGAGTVVLRDGAEIGGVTQTGDTLINVDNTISGSGNIGDASMTLVNEAKGVIDANAKFGLVLDTIGGTLVNAGFIEATGGGTLSIDSTTVQGTGGTISTIYAGAGSTINLLNVDIAGGTLATNGNGVILLDGFTASRLDGLAHPVTNAGYIHIRDNAPLTLAGMVFDRGAIALENGVAHDPTQLEIDGAGATLRGGGQVLLGGAQTVITGLTAGAVLTNLDFIVGTGQLGADNLVLINGGAGLIDAAGAGTLFIDTTGGAFTNDGTLAADGSGRLIVADAVSGLGFAHINGGTMVFDAAFNQPVQFGLGGGTLQLARSQGFTAPVTGFSPHGATTLNLADIGFVSAGEASFSGTASSGVLTVTDGTHTAHITLLGNYLNTTFIVTQNGTGVAITDRAPAAPSPHPLVAAMASLGAGAAVGVHAIAEPWRERFEPIAAPRASIA